ncbi:pectate lyase, partial [Elizabethkingia anophelis]|uniref:pectate lyase n=2 Tax=Bacteroidota TaxID=976 RepID=UPI001C891EDF
MTKELTLSFPQRNGFFPGLIATEMKEVEVEGKKYWRSAGWNTHFFGNSNRNPYTWNAKESPYHILDMSYTALLMLDWYSELEKDPRLLDYAIRYADALVNIQRPDGYFPAWLDLNQQKDMELLSKSPESAMSVSFLLRLYQISKVEKYKASALKALDVIVKEIVPVGRWED